MIIHNLSFFSDISKSQTNISKKEKDLFNDHPLIDYTNHFRDIFYIYVLNNSIL